MLQVTTQNHRVVTQKYRFEQKLEVLAKSKTRVLQLACCSLRSDIRLIKAHTRWNMRTKKIGSINFLFLNW